MCNISVESNGKGIERRGTRIKLRKRGGRGLCPIPVPEQGTSAFRRMEEHDDGEKNAGNR